MPARLKRFLTGGQFKQRHAFLYAASRDAEEVLSIWLGEPPVAFGDVGGDGERGAVELVGEEEVAAGKPLVNVQTALAKSMAFW